MGFVEVAFRLKEEANVNYITHLIVQVPEQDITEETDAEIEALGYLVKTHGLDKLKLEYLYEDDHRK